MERDAERRMSIPPTATIVQENPYGEMVERNFDPTAPGVQRMVLEEAKPLPY